MLCNKRKVFWRQIISEKYGEVEGGGVLRKQVMTTMLDYGRP